jgi:hypothetical protein
LDKVSVKEEKLPEILFITTYPPRECGITILGIKKTKFKTLLMLKLQLWKCKTTPILIMKLIFWKRIIKSLTKLINTINVNHSLELVLIQHLVYLKPMKQILSFFKAINKPIIIVFHYLIRYATEIAEMNTIVDSFIVMMPRLQSYWNRITVF